MGLRNSTLTVVSEPGRGSIFTLHLPAQDQAPGAESDPAST